MRLDKEYCVARANYCAAMLGIIDRVEVIRTNPSMDLIKAVISNSGISEPYTPENFEDEMCMEVDEYIAQLFNDKKLETCRNMIAYAQNKAPRPEEVTPGVGNATWSDMQKVIHEGLESSMGLIAKSLPDTDPAKQKSISCQVTYHAAYNSIEKGDAQTIHQDLNDEDGAELSQSARL